MNSTFDAQKTLDSTAIIFDSVRSVLASRIKIAYRLRQPCGNRKREGEKEKNNSKDGAFGLENIAPAGEFESPN